MRHLFGPLVVLLVFPLLGFARGALPPQKMGAWDYSDRAKQEYRSGDQDAAIADFRQAIKMSPNTALFHNDLGITLFSLRRLKEAQAEIREAIRLDPKSGESYSNLCLVDIELNDFFLAKSNARIAVKLKPADTHAWNNLGVANLKLKKYQEAADALNRAVSLQPHNFLAHNNRGAALYRLGKKSEAIKEWKFVLKNVGGHQHDQAQDYLDHPEHS